jgi:hypothetical protein
VTPHKIIPTLHFFRATPPALLENPPLASSLQSLETALFLISLGRYPSALVSCVSAWESAIKARLRIPPEDDRAPIAKLLGQVRESFAGLKVYDRAKLDDLRQTRNRIVHYGFSPKDDGECGHLLVETGLPFLGALYRELFDFYLDWRDVRPDASDFMQLNQQEAACVGLLPDLADQMQIIARMYELNRKREDFDVRFVFAAFAHYLRLRMRDSYASRADDTVAERAASLGIRYEAEAEEKERIAKRLGGETWEFDCPMCYGTRSLVAGLNEEALNSNQVTLSWGVCVSCHLVMPADAYHLADLVLQAEVKEQAPAILADYR